jgi:hypothetical protein
LALKTALVKALQGPKGQHLITPKNMRSEKWLDGQLRDLEPVEAKGQLMARKSAVEQGLEPITSRWSNVLQHNPDGSIDVIGAHVEAGWSGKHTVVVDDKDLIEDQGALFAYHGTQEDGIVAMIKGDGLMSNRAKWQAGFKIGSSGSSVGADFSYGGSNSTFTRIARKGAVSSGWGNVGGSSPKMIFHPRVFERTDWWCWDTDGFGSTMGSKGGDPSIGRASSLQVNVSSNECDFADGISNRYLAGVCAMNSGERLSIIKKLQAEGINAVNGIAVEEFVSVYSGDSRNEMAATVKGLKKGVLPL